MATAKQLKQSQKVNEKMWYIESSALVAALLEQDITALKVLRSPGHLITSALTMAEAYRAVVRARVSGRLSINQERIATRALRTFETRCAVVTVSDSILTRAGHQFSVEPIRTLDAIHLATVESLGEPPALITVVTRDIRVRENAEAIGYAVA